MFLICFHSGCGWSLEDVGFPMSLHYMWASTCVSSESNIRSAVTMRDINGRDRKRGGKQIWCDSSRTWENYGKLPAFPLYMHIPKYKVWCPPLIAHARSKWHRPCSWGPGEIDWRWSRGLNEVLSHCALQVSAAVPVRPHSLAHWEIVA